MSADQPALARRRALVIGAQGLPGRHGRPPEAPPQRGEDARSAARSTRSSSRSASSCEDRLRLVQRATRDHFTAIADELHRSLADSVLAAQKAATMYAAERDSRVTALRRTSSGSTRSRSAPARSTPSARLDAISTAVPETPTDAAVGAPSAPSGRLRRDRRRARRGARTARRRRRTVPRRPRALRRLERALDAARRAASRGHRRHGEGRQVDAAERDHRRGDRARPTPASAPGSSPGTATARRRASRCTSRTGEHPARCRCAATAAAWCIDLGRHRRPRRSSGSTSTGPRSGSRT